MEPRLCVSPQGHMICRGQVVRCDEQHRVGLTIEGIRTEVANAVTEGCEIGVVDLGHESRIVNVTPQSTSVGFYLGGFGGWVESNTAIRSGLAYVLVGHAYTLLTNRAWDSLHVGYLVTGHGNLLQGNEALRSGQAGFYVSWQTPGVRESQALLFLKQKGVGNVLTGNTALDNGVDLAEVPPKFQGDCDENTWQDNTFETSDLPEPCPPERHVRAALSMAVWQARRCVWRDGKGTQLCEPCSPTQGLQGELVDQVTLRLAFRHEADELAHGWAPARKLIDARFIHGRNAIGIGCDSQQEDGARSLLISIFPQGIDGQRSAHDSLSVMPITMSVEIR